MSNIDLTMWPVTDRHSPQISSAPAFNPANLSGLSLWLSADVGTFQDTGRSTPAAADNDPVGGWTDQSGAGNHGQQATSTLRPLLKLNSQNGKSGIQFDGVDDVIFADTLAAIATGTDIPVSIMIVGKTTVGSATWWSFGNSGTATPNFRGQTTGIPNLFCGRTDDASTATSRSAGSPSISNVTNILQWVFTGTGISMAVDGAALAGNTLDVGVTTLNQFALGRRHEGSSFFNANAGTFYEIIAYNRALSTAENTLVRNYLNAKWAVY